MNKNCADCGHVNQDSSSFCKKCGLNLGKFFQLPKIIRKESQKQLEFVLQNGKQGAD